MDPRNPTYDSDKLYQSNRLDEKDELLRRDVDEGFGIPLRASWDEMPQTEIGPGQSRLRPHWSIAVAIVASGVLLAFIFVAAYWALATAGALTGAVSSTLLWMAAAGGGAVIGMIVAWRAWPAHRYTNPVVPATIGLVAGVLFAAGALSVVWLLRGMAG